MRPTPGWGPKGAQMAQSKLNELFDITQDEGIDILACKSCNKTFCMTPTDKAARARALMHGLGHGGIQPRLTPPKK